MNDVTSEKRAFVECSTFAIVSKSSPAFNGSPGGSLRGIGRSFLPALIAGDPKPTELHPCPWVLPWFVCHGPHSLSVTSPGSRVHCRQGAGWLSLGSVSTHWQRCFLGWSLFLFVLSYFSLLRSCTSSQVSSFCALALSLIMWQLHEGVNHATVQEQEGSR